MVQFSSFQKIFLQKSRRTLLTVFLPYVYLKHCCESILCLYNTLLHIVPGTVQYYGGKANIKAITGRKKPKHQETIY